MFQVDQSCYSTALAAASASSSRQIGSIISQGTSSFLVDVQSVSASSITYVLQPIAGGSPLILVSPYSAQPCGLLTVSDGLEIGWMVGAAWLAAFALLFLTRGLRGSQESAYGNS